MPWHSLYCDEYININDTQYLLHNAHKIMQCGMCLRHDSNPICALPKFRKPREKLLLLVLYFQPQHKTDPPILGGSTGSGAGASMTTAGSGRFD